MDRIKIEDSYFLLRFACDDLRSLRAVMQAVEIQTDCIKQQDVLAVVIRALEPIINDIQKAVDFIYEEQTTESDSRQ